MQKRKNKHAVALGRLGGIRTSTKKKKSSARNGLLGGRPAKRDLQKSPKRAIGEIEE